MQIERVSLNIFDIWCTHSGPAGGGLGIKISNIIFWSETIPPCVMECVRGILSWKTWFKYRKYLIEVSDIANFTLYFEKLQFFIWDSFGLYSEANLNLLSKYLGLGKPPCQWVSCGNVSFLR